MTLEEFLKTHKNKKIVFTNGCFDLLHPGHVTYLAQAKRLGDVLIVGLNSDASIKRLKGEERPIQCEYDRKVILEHLRSVDFVEIFHDDTPLELIKKINPYVLVKGGDWPVSSIVGSKEVLAAGGEVKTLLFIEGKSTTGLVTKIKKL
jgi:D-beta-D-heptose 7-phosphate kinase/D-beta-D-heptose 1-phosphate adenosyltransferase